MYNHLTTAIVFINVELHPLEIPSMSSTRKSLGYFHNEVTMNIIAMSMRILILFNTKFNCIEKILRRLLGSIEMLTIYENLLYLRHT